MKKKAIYYRYLLTMYRYTLIATAQLLYIAAAFMPVLQALADVSTEYYDILATETKKIASIIFNITNRTISFLQIWYPEAIKFRAEICRENRAGEYV